jgi:ABC-type Fe3+-hydroxamate transport system substrate-binding protein
MRIISSVPSQSELLYDLGLRTELIGITKFCIHPNEMFTTIKRVGGTKNLDLDVIRELKPDLIIANKEENEKVQIETLQKEFNVHVTEIYTLEDSYKMIEEVGEMVGKKEKALEMVGNIKKQFSTLSTPAVRKKVLYLIWKNPYMAAGKNTIIDNLLEHAGYENCLSKSRYPELTLAEIEKLNPELIFLSSEPYPFKQKHIQEFSTLINTNALVVDGEMFSWYGSRLLKAPNYFRLLQSAL